MEHKKDIFKEEITSVLCIKSDCQERYKVGETYKLIDNIPLHKDGINSVYTWNNYIRKIDNNLAQFKK